MTYFQPMLIFMEDLIERLRAFRARQELSQTDFADRFGLCRDTYRQWERGRRRPDMASYLLLRVIMAEPDLVAAVAEDLRPSLV